jgi:fission process protein 1
MRDKIEGVENININTNKNTNLITNDNKNTEIDIFNSNNSNINKNNIKLLKEKEYDIYKDSYLRFLGYSNEIGEAFRKITSKNFVAFTYILEFAYFAGDTLHKGHKAYHDPKSADNKYYYVIKHSGYTVLWQFFATCLIPALAINIVVGRVHNILTYKKFSQKTIRYTPLSIGLLMIPLFNIYIDPIVGDSLDYLFDKHLI